MHAHQLFARHREHVERIVVAEVGLRGEREVAEIGELPKIARMHTRFVEGFAVVRDIVVGARQRPGHAPGLQRDDLVAGRPLGLVHLGVVTTCLGLKFHRGHHASSCV